MKKILLLSLALITILTSCASPMMQLNSGADDEISFSQIDASQNKLEQDVKNIEDIENIEEYALQVNNAKSANKISFTDENGKAAYKIVYPEKTVEIIHDAAEALRVALKEATGKNFKKQSDATADSDDAYEILIGDTNREQSKHTLSEKEYSIKVDGKKIVIVGGSYYSTAVALSKFKALFSKEDPCVNKSLNVNGTLDPLYRVAVSNSGDTSIDIYEITPFNTKAKLVKTFKDVGATGLNFRKTDKHGEVVVCASGSVVKVIKYDTGKVVWSKSGIANSAHGAELLPNGVVAVASSTPNTLSFFDMNSSASKTLTLDDAHAVLWDPKNEVVWAAGYTEIRAYTVKLSGGKLTVTEDAAKRSPFNNTGAHDLAPVYGDKDKMWVSTFGKIYVYDKTTNKFSESINGSNGIVCGRRVKGLGNFPDGSMITTYPDEKSTSLYTWTTEKLNFYFMYEGKLYFSPVYTPKEHYYKVRIVCTDYQ